MIMTDKETQTDQSKPTIINTILVLIYGLMQTRHSNYIKCVIVSRFDLTALRKAREVLFRQVDPGIEYKGYRGQNGASDRDKVVGAFDSIFARMLKLDKDSKDIPTFAVSAEDAVSLLAAAESHTPCDAKFAKYDEEMRDVKGKLQQFTDLMQQRQILLQQSLMSSHPASSISEDVRSRLNSSGSVKRQRTLDNDEDDDDVFKSCIDSSVESDSEEIPFKYPPAYAKKLAREAKKMSPEKPHTVLRLRDGRSMTGGNSSTVNPRPPASRPLSQMGNRQPRRDTVWGKAQSNTASKFKGVPYKVPEIFVHMCDRATGVSDVKEYLTGESINVIGVEKVSNERARFSSFKVTVSKREDFDKMLTGNHGPQGVGVRRYYVRRENSDPPQSSGTFIRQASLQLNQFPTLSHDSESAVKTTSQVSAQVHTETTAVTQTEMDTSNAASTDGQSRNDTA